MKNGKRLTVAQMKILNKNGISDAGEWLYVSTISTKGNFDKTKVSADHERYMVVVNKNTGEQRNIPLK